MSTKDKLLAVLCVALHLYVLWNVWEVSWMTPRVLEFRLDSCYI